MKFSVSWLREFVDLPENLEELTDLLTMAGIEIESIENTGADIDNVIVAEITASSRHPDADRLSVCEVNDGTPMKRQIVCGATNYRVGDKVPLALPGAVLPNGTKIRETKLRGVQSEGMLCSAIELGLGEDAAGLMILSPFAKTGAPLKEVFPKDTVLDVEITPNRGDLLSHFGLAREIAAITGKTVRKPFDDSAGPPPAIEREAIHLSAPDLCPFFSARLVEKVKVGPSPDWLRLKIEGLGIRSINNIVDISNFVMLELGQPTHAFDADKLKSGIDVRLAREGEKFLALDGKTYSLTPENLMIADDERPIGIGGVMGGEETGVTDDTRNVLLEAAYFSPASIRRTARLLNLPSDASYRFERGVDPGMILRASQRAAELMKQIAGGHPAPKVWVSGDPPSNPPDVRIRYARCRRLLGVNVERNRTDDILSRFGLTKVGESNGEAEAGSTWKIPSHRRDLRREVDLIEEVVRIFGVHQIAGSDRSRFTSSSGADIEHDREANLRRTLAGRGLSEARTSKLIPRNAVGFAERAVELRNPLSEEHVALRPTLIGGLLDVLGRNVRAGAERVTVFEIGRIFQPPNAREERHVGILMWGRAHAETHWRNDAKRRLDFFDLKGAISSVLGGDVSFRRASRDHLALAVDIVLADQVIGWAGQLSRLLASKADAPGAVLVAEFLDSAATQIRESSRKFDEFGRFPAITRDIAMIVPETVTHENVYAEIIGETEPLLESVKLFDVFSGKDAQHIGSERKSLAYTLTYRDKSRTLTTDEVNAAHGRIRERLQSKLGAELRE
ncbi:MAG TPA: phenylalanine--tRNA ligase subunit beta [Chthoniobacterales bacterium]|nr:phenylalanine--tRNA ligase subunit beta [Chthoniobacterales bacterium]